MGKVLQAAQSGTLIVPISKQEYMSRKSTIQSRGGKGGKGSGKASTGGDRVTVPMEVNDSDVGALKMFKRKRRQNECRQPPAVHQDGDWDPECQWLAPSSAGVAACRAS